MLEGNKEVEKEMVLPSSDEAYTQSLSDTNCSKTVKPMSLEVNMNYKNYAFIRIAIVDL